MNCEHYVGQSDVAALKAVGGTPWHRRCEGEVRLLPYSTDGNMILCRRCYELEIDHRRELIREGIPMKMPTWNSLNKYEEN